MIIFVQAILRLLAAFVGLNALPVRRRRSVEAENRFLRRELALYQERGVRPSGVDAATRALLALLYRLFDWGHALAVVRHETLIRWHQVGWRLFWRPNGPDRISAEHNGIAFIEVPIKRGQL